MTNLLSGLHIYEQVFLILGIALTFTALFLLILATRNNKPLKQVLPLFFVSIVMIGFPAFSKIEITADGVKLEKMISDPSRNFDQAKATELNAKIAARPNLDPQTVLRTTFNQSILDPINFQYFVEANQRNFGTAFYSCVATIKYRLQNALDPSLGMSFGYKPSTSEPTEADKFYLMLSDIESVTKGEKKWLQTFFGSTLVRGVTEDPEGHEELKSFLKIMQELYQSVLSC